MTAAPNERPSRATISLFELVGRNLAAERLEHRRSYRKAVAVPNAVLTQ
jgi:hypothetical protein